MENSGNINSFTRANTRLNNFEAMGAGYFLGGSVSARKEDIDLCRSILSWVESNGYDSIDFAMNEFGVISFLVVAPEAEIEVILEHDKPATYIITREGQTEDVLDFLLENLGDPRKPCEEETARCLYCNKLKPKSEIFGEEGCSDCIPF